MPDRMLYHCSSDPVGEGWVECTLMRWVRRDIKWRPDVEEPVEVLARGRFPEHAVGRIAVYESELTRAADEARAGRYGCYVQAIPLSDGGVELEVIEQVMERERFRRTVLRTRTIDATAEDAVVTGTEALAELQAWADARNEERRERMIVAESELGLPDLDTEEAERRAASARELATLLTRRG